MSQFWMVDYSPAGKPEYKQPYVYAILHDVHETAFELRYSVFTNKYFFDGVDVYNHFNEEGRQKLLKDFKFEYGDYFYKLKADTELAAAMDVNNVLPMWEYE